MLPYGLEFHQYAYHSYVWATTTYRGVKVEKYPTDLWAYQEIIHETKPTLIIETGTRWGGSAYYFADLLARQGEGRVLSIDVEYHDDWPQHERITYLTGSSTDSGICSQVLDLVRFDDRVMVILDSDHSAAHVRSELRFYPNLVSVGCYLVVEDTNVNGHPVLAEHGPGPWEALDAWLPQHPEFVLDQAPERFGVSFHPGGWLKRVRA